MNNLSFAQVAHLIERKQADEMVELALEARPVAGGWMTFGGPGSYVNKACGLGIDRPVTEPEFDELVTFFTSRGVEPKVELSPFVHPSLPEGLARRCPSGKRA